MYKYTFKFSILFFGLLLLASCSSEEEPMPTPDPDPMTGGMNENFDIYMGAKMTFTKADNTDETNAGNQDRINDDVWITRGTSGGEIFNIRKEGASQKGTSPVGTEWALGTTADISSLTFASLRNTTMPNGDIVGKDLVMHLIDEDAYVDVKFTAWSSGKTGGFAYERTTK